MRVIEKKMLDAVRQLRAFKCDNTEVVEATNQCNHAPMVRVYLHGNHIANVTQVRHDELELQVMTDTLARWPSNTTISRLRALGANIEVRNGCVSLNGVHVTTR